MTVWVGEEGMPIATKFRFATTLDRNQVVLHFDGQPYFVTPFSDSPNLYLWVLINFLTLAQAIESDDYDTANAIISKVIWSFFTDLTVAKIEHFNNSDWDEVELFKLLSYVMAFTNDRLVYLNKTDQLNQFCDGNCSVCPLHEYHKEHGADQQCSTMLDQVSKRWSN